MTTIYLSLGSNLGNRENNLLQGIGFLKKEVNILKVSSLYETKPWGNARSPYFINCCLSAETKFRPLQLLNFTKQIERILGRKEKGNFLPRILDIDILYYGMQKIILDNLIIPHPKIYQRNFVIVPLQEIAEASFLQKMKLNLVPEIKSNEVALWKENNKLNFFKNVNHI